MISKNNVTYKELSDFYDKTISNLSVEERVNLFVSYQNFKEIEKIKKHILSMFPEIDNLELEAHFIDSDITMAVITVYRNNEVLTYFSYHKTYGLMRINFDNFDLALLGCFSLKYFNGSGVVGPHYWIARMLGINTGKNNNTNNIKEEIDIKEENKEE